MRLWPSSRSDDGRSPATVISISLCALLVSCSGDDPAGLSALGPAAEAVDASVLSGSAAPTGKPGVHHDALSIEDMLDDPLFRALVLAVEDPDLAQPLRKAVDALASGRTARAVPLLGTVAAEAVNLEDDPSAAASLICWSALERYFEEAELM